MKRLNRKQLSNIKGGFGSIGGCTAWCGSTDPEGNGWSIHCKGSPCEAIDQDKCESPTDFQKCSDGPPNGSISSF